MNHTTVLHLTDSLQIGGAERVLMDLAIRQQESGMRSIVCSIDDGPLAEHLKKNGIKVISLQKKGFGDINYLWKLYQVVNREEVQLVHSHFLISDIYGWLVSKLCRIPQAITLHGRSLFGSKHGTNVFPFIAARTNRIIAVSRHLRDELIKLSPGSKVNVIYNGIDVEKIRRHTIDSRTAKNRIGFKYENFVVGTVGGLRKVKGHIFLLEAMHKVLKSFPNAYLVFAGDGPERSSLQEKAKALKIEDRALFLGYRDDIPQVISAFDIFVCSSLTEGISIALLEAMATSKPLVVTNVGGNPEIVKENITGILVPPNDAQALAEGIISLIGDENKRNKMANAGFRRVKEMFSLDRNVEAYKKVYRDVLNKH